MNKTIASLLICAIMATCLAGTSWAEANKPPLTSGRKSDAESVAFEKAVKARTDAALIEFIKCWKSDSSYDQMAIDKLKSYKRVPNNTVIPWANIPSVSTGESDISKMEGFPCAINMNAFSARVTEECIGNYMILGPVLFFKPDTTTLHFGSWTIFDKYIAKGKALIKLNGLSFTDDSVVLERNTGS